jgi:hypothetical protein
MHHNSEYAKTVLDVVSAYHITGVSLVQHSSLSSSSAPQLFQQRPGLLQVGRFEPPGEPAVDRCQKLAGFFSVALLLPQATQG